MTVRTEKKKSHGLLAIALIAAAALVLALCVVPAVHTLTYRDSALAARLVENYAQETGQALPQGEVAWDLAWIGRHLATGAPEAISGTTDDGRAIYLFRFGDETYEEINLIDVTRPLLGSTQFHIRTPDGAADNWLEYKPWGTLYLDGQKAGWQPF